MRVNELGYAVAQVAGFAAGGFVYGAANVKKPLAPMTGGLFVALITGGDLAIYYATNIVAEKCKMTQWKAQVLQGSLIGLYNVAVITAFVAYGIFTIPTAIYVGLITLIGSVPSIAMGLSNRHSSELTTRALPESFRDIRFLRA